MSGPLHVLPISECKRNMDTHALHSAVQRST